MSKSLLHIAFLVFLLVSPIHPMKVSSHLTLTAHEANIGDMKINELIQKIMPHIDLSRPLYDFGSLVSRGGRVVSPGLNRAGQISTAVGVVFVNIGTLLLTLSQLLSGHGAIGGNPNFLNDALNQYLVKANVQNVVVKAEPVSTVPLSEVANRLNDGSAGANAGGNAEEQPQGGEQQQRGQGGQGAQEGEAKAQQQPQPNNQENKQSESKASSSTQASSSSQNGSGSRQTSRRNRFRWVEHTVDPIIKEPQVIRIRN